MYREKILHILNLMHEIPLLFGGWYAGCGDRFRDSAYVHKGVPPAPLRTQNSAAAQSEAWPEAWP